MRCLKRNMQKFHYALYRGKHFLAETDEYGNRLESGEYQLVYDNPVPCYGNISAATGETVAQLFGTSEIYDKVIMLENPNLPIDEYTILWIDKTPDVEVLSREGVVLPNVNGGVVVGDDGRFSAHDYIVKRIARSINSIAIAVSKVTVRNA